MDEATPRWRGFSSQAGDKTELETAATESRRWTGGWLPPLVAGLGGLGAGIATLGLLLLAVGALQPPGESVFAALDAQPSRPGLSLVPEPAPVDIVVDVAGAVARPGLHRLDPGARVGDAIEAAGGFAPRADLGAASHTLNLAQTLADGAKVLVPELGIDRATTSGSTADAGSIDLNRASQSELESLPGVGPVTAGKIIDAREDARFDSVRELRSRGIVGESVYEDIQGLVRAS